MTKIGAVGVFLFAIALIVACAPSKEEASATAIAEYDLTQVADPSLTPTVTPSPTATLTATPTATATPTITPTATPTDTPSPTATPQEKTADGLPIFPEPGMGRGNGIEIAFSQGLLNALGIQGVRFPEQVMNDAKDAFIGTWLWQLRAPGYNEIPKPSRNLARLKEANEQGTSITIWADDAYLQFGPQTRLRIDFVKGNDEFTALKEALETSEQGHVYDRRIRGLVLHQITNHFIYHDGEQFRLVGMVSPSSLRADGELAASVIGRLLWQISYHSASMIFDIARENGRSHNPYWDDNIALFVDGLYEGWVLYGGTGHREFDAVFGGCDYLAPSDGVYRCKSGTEAFQFVIDP